MGRVQQPITNFTRLWDNFMVHGVNNPLTGYCSRHVGLGNTRISTDYAQKNSPNTWLGLKLNRLRFKTSGKLPIILEEDCRIYPQTIKKCQKTTTCNRLDLGSTMILIDYTQKSSPDIGCLATWMKYLLRMKKRHTLDVAKL